MEETVFDLGTVQYDEEVTVTFKFRNVGDETLEIYDVESISDDLYAVLSAKTFDPGDSGHIEVTMDTKGHVGILAGRVSVITNDREHREMLLEVKAKVQPLLAFNPPFIWVGQVARDHSYKNKARLIGKIIDDGEFSGLTVNKTNPRIKAEIIFHNIKGNRIPYLEIVLLPELRSGTFRESVSVTSEDPPAEAQLILYGHKLGIIEVTPDRFDFFPREDLNPDERIVTLESGKEFHIAKTEANVDYLDVSIEVIEEGKKYEVKAKMKESAKESFLGLIKVYTDLEEYPIIDIPVIGGPES
jgi:hypothetical protein